MRILRIADAVTAGGTPAAKTVEPSKTALAEVIAKVFPDDPGEQTTTKETQPQPKAGAEGGTTDLSQTQPPADEPAEVTAEIEAAAKERNVTPEQHRNDLATEQARIDAITAKTGETLEQIYEREEKEGKPTDLNAENLKAETLKKFSQEELEATVQKRVRTLASENEDLKRQLAAKPVVATPDTFEQMEANAQTGLDQAEDLMEQLRSEPDGVAEVLRKWLGANADKADLSPAGMRTILRNAKRGFEKTLGDVNQQRQQHQAERANVQQLLKEPELVKALPFMADEESDEHAQYVQLTKLPQLANHPRGEYLAAALMIGFEKLKPLIGQIADRKNGKVPKNGAGAGQGGCGCDGGCGAGMKAVMRDA